MTDLASTIARIPPLDATAMHAATVRQGILTKPPQALGRLETLSIQLAGISGHPLPSLARKAVAVMAGDHGVLAEGVSVYPAEVTPQMVYNFVTDVGVAADIADVPGVRHCKVRAGTANMAVGPAMTRAEALQALQVGLDLVDEEAGKGLDIIATGEMGIGNTTPSSAIIAALTGLPVARVTGRGTGISDAALARKVAVIERALAVNRPDRADPIEVMAKVGGLEIAALTGVILGAAAHRIPVVMDGFISGAAALTAARLCPGVVPYILPSHLSVEIGHQVVMAELGLTPLFDLDMRLGEGTGAALAMTLLDAAAKTLCEMATFASAGVTGEMVEENA